MINKLPHYRKLARLSQAQLGELLGITQGAVGNYERGDRDVSLTDCRKIIGLFNERGVACVLEDVFPLEPDATLGLMDHWRALESAIDLLHECPANQLTERLDELAKQKERFSTMLAQQAV